MKALRSNPSFVAASWAVIVIVVVSCAPGVPGDGDDGTTGTPDTGTTGTSPRIECVDLCARVIACVETPFTGECDWLAADDPERCEARCNAIDPASLDGQCIACLSTRLVCAATGPLRPCDAVCEPTAFVTGYDFEGAAEYDYTTYLCE